MVKISRINARTVIKSSSENLQFNGSKEKVGKFIDLKQLPSIMLVEFSISEKIRCFIIALSTYKK